MELVGYCTVCGKPVYCKGGFLDGILDDSHKLYCHLCYSPELINCAPYPEKRKKPTK